MTVALIQISSTVVIGQPQLWWLLNTIAFYTVDK
jgi:hypothetical protein